MSVAVVLKLPEQEKMDWRTKLRRIDFLGALVLVGAVFGLLLGLDRGSNVSWALPITIGSLAASVALFAIFVFVEIRMAAEPFAPGHIIFERSLFACYLCNFFSFGGWLAALFYLPLFFQAVDGLSATGAGLRLLPAILAGVSGSLFGGVVMKKTGKYYWITVIAYTVVTFGMIIILLFAGLIDNNTYGISVGMVMCGFGNGIGVTTTLIGLSRSSMRMAHEISANFLSRQCISARSSHCDSMLVSIPVLGICRRSLPVRDGGAAVSPNSFTGRFIKR